MHIQFAQNSSIYKQLFIDNKINEVCLSKLIEILCVFQLDDKDMQINCKSILRLDGWKRTGALKTTALKIEQILATLRMGYNI